MKMTVRAFLDNLIYPILPYGMTGVRMILEDFNKERCIKALEDEKRNKEIEIKNLETCIKHFKNLGE